MKRAFRLPSLILALITLLSVTLTSCQTNAAGIEDVVSRPTMTLELYTIVNDTTTEEAVQMVEDELNKITKVKYMTQIKLVALTEDEYNDKLAEAFEYIDEQNAIASSIEESKKESEKASKEQAKKDKAAGITQAETRAPKTTNTTAEQTDRLTFPEVDPLKPQADIFLVRSYDELVNLIGTEDKSYVAPLDEQMSVKGKILSKYLNANILSAGKVGGKQYAIPNNKAIGEYTWLAINDELYKQFLSASATADTTTEATTAAATTEAAQEDTTEGTTLSAEEQEKADYEATLAKITDISGLTKYFEWLQANHPTVVPFNSTVIPEKYFDDIGSNDASFPITSAAGAAAAVANKFAPASKLFTAALLTNQFKLAGIIPASTPADNAVYGAKIVTGTLEELAAIKSADTAQYTYTTYIAPTATKQTALESAYVINANTKSIPRAMEIVVELATNPELKNILSYGVLGTHYIYNDDGVIERISDAYSINKDYTGNALLADLEVGESADLLKNIKTQNYEMRASAVLGMDFSATDLDEALQEDYYELGEIGRKYYDRIVAGDIAALARELLPSYEQALDPETNAPLASSPDKAIKTAEINAALDALDYAALAKFVGESITAEMEKSSLTAILDAAKAKAPVVEEAPADAAATPAA